MDNLKKIGLTALGTVLVAGQAQAASVSASASTSIFFILIFTLFSSSINAASYVAFSNGYQAWALS